MGLESWLCHSCVTLGKPLNLSGLVSSICRNGISIRALIPTGLRIKGADLHIVLRAVPGTGRHCMCVSCSHTCLSPWQV